MAAIAVEFPLAVHLGDVRAMFMDARFYEQLAILERAETVELSLNDHTARWTRRLRLGFLALTAEDTLSWETDTQAQLQSNVSGPGVSGHLTAVLTIAEKHSSQAASTATLAGDYDLSLPAHLTAFAGAATTQLAQAISLRGAASRRWARAD